MSRTGHVTLSSFLVWNTHFLTKSQLITLRFQHFASLSNHNICLFLNSFPASLTDTLIAYSILQMSQFHPQDYRLKFCHRFPCWNNVPLNTKSDMWYAKYSECIQWMCMEWRSHKISCMCEFERDQNKFMTIYIISY